MLRLVAMSTFVFASAIPHFVLGQRPRDVATVQDTIGPGERAFVPQFGMPTPASLAPTMGMPPGGYTARGQAQVQGNGYPVVAPTGQTGSAAVATPTAMGPVPSGSWTPQGNVNQGLLAMGTPMGSYAPQPLPANVNVGPVGVVSMAAVNGPTTGSMFIPANRQSLPGFPSNGPSGVPSPSPYAAGVPVSTFPNVVRVGFLSDEMGNGAAPATWVQPRDAAIVTPSPATVVPWPMVPSDPSTASGQSLTPPAETRPVPQPLPRPQPPAEPVADPRPRSVIDPQLPTPKPSIPAPAKRAERKNDEPALLPFNPQNGARPSATEKPNRSLDELLPAPPPKNELTAPKGVVPKKGAEELPLPRGTDGSSTGKASGPPRRLETLVPDLKDQPLTPPETKRSELSPPKPPFLDDGTQAAPSKRDVGLGNEEEFVVPGAPKPERRPGNAPR